MLEINLDSLSLHEFLNVTFLYLSSVMENGRLEYVTKIEFLNDNLVCKNLIILIIYINIL